MKPRIDLTGRLFGSYVTRDFRYYVYIHSTPDGTPFYIGKGSLYRAFRIKHSRSKPHNRIVNRYGAAAIRVSLIECQSNEEAQEREKRLIAEYSAVHSLVNLSTGGQGAAGYKHTAEARLNMSVSRRGVKWTAERKAHHSIATKGRIQTEATREKIAASWTPERKALARLAMTNGTAPLKGPDIGLKISIGKKGKLRPDMTVRRLGSIWVHTAEQSRVVRPEVAKALLLQGWKWGMGPRRPSP